MIRPLVKLTSSRTWVISSQPACLTAGVMYFVQMSRSLSSFLFIGLVMGLPFWPMQSKTCNLLGRLFLRTPNVPDGEHLRRRRLFGLAAHRSGQALSCYRPETELWPASGPPNSCSMLDTALFSRTNSGP